MAGLLRLFLRGLAFRPTIPPGPNSRGKGHNGLGLLDWWDLLNRNWRVTPVVSGEEGFHIGGRGVRGYGRKEEKHFGLTSFLLGVGSAGAAVG